MRSTVRIVLTAFLAGLFVACGGGEDDGGGSLTISGAAPSEVSVGSPYSFTPSVGNAGGGTLSFSVTNLPPWASFDAATGEISGMPGAADLGQYANIGITVSDGTGSATLAAFSITVVDSAAGSVTLSWIPPTENTDGSPLEDLDGYRVYWGPSAGNYTQSVTIDNEGLTTYVVEGLTPGTWYFVTTAVNSLGIESAFSNVASKSIL